MPQPPRGPPPPGPDSSERNSGAQFPVSTGIQVASADAPADIPAAFANGKPFKVGPKSKCAAFGARLEEYSLSTCYGCEVPNVLLALWTTLVRGGGLRMQGIFRLAPDPTAALLAEKQLAKGTLAPNTPPEVLAHLIKSFLRRLPGSLLGNVPREVIEACQDGPGYVALRQRLNHLERGVLEWIVRVICEVAQYRSENMMGLRNLTLVIAPNLLVPTQPAEHAPRSKFRPGLRRGSNASPASPAMNPMEELMNIELVSNMMHTLAASSVRFAM